MGKDTSWERFKKYYFYHEGLGLGLDISSMNFAEDFWVQQQGMWQESYDFMAALENGAVANPSEQRQVGHYWLRAAHLAPQAEIARDILNTLDQITNFSRMVHAGEIKSSTGNLFRQILLIGIGGSALGPQLATQALGTNKDQMEIFFLDNTDPEGMDLVFEKISSRLQETLVLVISKSGGTVETRNGLLETEHTFSKAGLNFSRHAVAITTPGSKLEKWALEQDWLSVFHIWDWVGGRTSQTSAVGLLPAALQGYDFRELLRGAALCDEITRKPEVKENPAALLALMWYHATRGEGGKTMVVLPYKDRLQLFGKYLQQLLMESLGKEESLSGSRVNQGLAVMGNKGSTDQHSYVQQLLDGPDNTFTVFIEVYKDRSGPSMQVEEGITSGDYLQAFLQGTRKALRAKGREALTITLESVTPFTLGLLLALFERAVGYYAQFIKVNAYDQPAVERGKRGAKETLELQLASLNYLREHSDRFFTAHEIAQALKREEDTEVVFKILEHAAANPDHGLAVHRVKPIYESKYGVS